MFRPMPLFLFSFLFVFASCNQSSESSQSTTSVSSAQSTSYWDTSSLPLTVKIASSFSASEITAIQAMGTEWSSSLNNQRTFFTMTTTTANKEYSNLDNYYDSEMGVYQLNTWPSDLPLSALAVTQLFGLRYSDHIKITHADILVNYQYFSFSVTHATTAAYDFKTVLLHELGHFLGLYHDLLSSFTVMYPYISTTTENRHPFNADIRNIASLYGLTSTTSYSGFLQANGALAQTMNFGGNLNVTSGSQVVAPSNDPVPFRAVFEIGKNGECSHHFYPTSVVRQD